MPTIRSDALARAAELLASVYVVDLAWLRTTPWRERLAASFDPPDRMAGALPARQRLDSPPTRAPGERAAAGGLAGLAASLEREPRPRRFAESAAASPPAGVSGIELAPVEQDAPGLAGVDRLPGRWMLAVAGPARGGLLARERAPDGEERKWKVLGASRGEGGILGEGVRQALLATRPTARR